MERSSRGLGPGGGSTGGEVKEFVEHRRGGPFLKKESKFHDKSSAR